MLFLTPRRQRVLSGILAGLPNIVAMVGMIIYFANRGSHPASLSVLGPAATWFTVLMIAANLIAGLAAIPPFPRLLYVEAAVRPIAAAGLFSYGVAVAAVPATAWITLGFAVALGLEQLRRWHSLLTVFIPESKALESLAAQETARGGTDEH